MKLISIFLERTYLNLVGRRGDGRMWVGGTSKVEAFSHVLSGVVTIASYPQAGILFCNSAYSPRSLEESRNLNSPGLGCDKSTQTKKIAFDCLVSLTVIRLLINIFRPYLFSKDTTETPLSSSCIQWRGRSPHGWRCQAWPLGRGSDPQISPW